MNFSRVARKPLESTTNPLKNLQDSKMRERVPRRGLDPSPPAGENPPRALQALASALRFCGGQGPGPRPCGGQGPGPRPCGGQGDRGSEMRIANVDSVPPDMYAARFVALSQNPSLHYPLDASTKRATWETSLSKLNRLR